MVEVKVVFDVVVLEDVLVDVAVLVDVVLVVLVVDEVSAGADEKALELDFQDAFDDIDETLQNVAQLSLHHTSADSPKPDESAEADEFDFDF